MTRDDEPEDSSWLQDHDWLELNKLLRAYKDGGDEAIKKAFRDLLEKDALQFARVACAYDLNRTPQQFKDAIEDTGYTFQELIELAKAYCSRRQKMARRLARLS
ncbi:MAG: hypothetical protein WCD69_07300 [Xanthobacteraceae bacterium]